MSDEFMICADCGHEHMNDNGSCTCGCGESEDFEEDMIEE